jgi:hypothetical protein
MGQILKVWMIFATLCGAVTVPPIFAQTPIFVLPSLDPTPAPNPPASTPPPAHAMYPANTALPAPSTTQPSALPMAHSASTALTTAPASQATPRHHSQPEVTSEFSTCRKRYADAVYNIGLALWTAPPPQHRALERLLNAAAAAQAVATNPNTTEQGRTFCADSTLNDLEATVVRLRAKGWVPMTEVEEHATRTTDVSDELKHAIAGISR